MEVKHLKTSEFDSYLKENKKVLVDFYADWCGPCKMQAPVLAEIAGEGKFNIAKLNVDDEETIAQRYQIYSIPTLIVFEDGEVKQRVSGVRSKSDLVAMLEK